MASIAQTVLAGIGPQPLQYLASRLLGLDEADRVYEQLRGSAPDLLDGLLQYLNVQCKAAPSDLAHIPRSGPCIVVANHPFGILEAAVLVTMLREVRPDIRVLANELLHALPELRALVIPVEVLHPTPRANAAGVRRAVEFVTGGGLLIVFPAGVVSHFHLRERASVDPPWRAEVARLLRRCKAPVVPVYVPGSNSFMFHAAGFIHRSARTALLMRELLNKRNRTVEIRVGHPITAEKLANMASDRERIDYLRWRTYLLGNRNRFEADTRKPLRRAQAGTQAPVVEPPPRETLAAEIGTLPAGCLLDQSGDLQVFLTRSDQIRATLREIGRLREVTFRQVGEGTGRELDLDRFDDGYLHLFVWNRAKQEVVGAYRLSPTDHVESLYTRTLFHFDQRFLRTMGPAVELGRSFIRAEYQKGFAPLLLLWKGIGKFIAANPQYRTLFGPVSISNQYQSVSRELMIAFLTKYASLTGWTGLVRARNAPPVSITDPRCDDVQELSEVISDVEPAQAGIPVLLRQYLKLGGKLLGFNVDPEFSDTLDGLILVDLTKTEPKLLERYLGRAEATSFLEYHKEPVHGTQ